MACFPLRKHNHVEAELRDQTQVRAEGLTLLRPFRWTPASEWAPTTDQGESSEINKRRHPPTCRGGFGIAGSCVRRQSLEAAAG